MPNPFVIPLIINSDFFIELCIACPLNSVLHVPYYVFRKTSAIGGGAPDFGFKSLNIYSVIVMQKKRTELKCAFGTMSFE